MSIVLNSHHEVWSGLERRILVIGPFSLATGASFSFQERGSFCFVHTQSLETFMDACGVFLLII